MIRKKKKKRERKEKRKKERKGREGGGGCRNRMDWTSPASARGNRAGGGRAVSFREGDDI